jgi:hypothetical protein
MVFARHGNNGGHVEAIEIPENGEDKPIEPMKLTLERPSNLKGRLLDAETGEPIRGGFVVLDDARKLEVGPDGRFEAPGLEFRNHRSFPICPGYASGLVLFDTTLQPEAELEVKLDKGGSVVGRVVDADGKPIPGAVVSGSGSGSMLCISALLLTCDENGRYVSGNRPIGKPINMEAHAPGYQADRRRNIIVPDVEHPTEVNFTLVPETAKTKVAPRRTAPEVSSRTVSGFVVANGKPVADTIVRWGMITDSSGAPETLADSEGHFSLGGMPDETNVLTIIVKGFLPRFPLVDGKGNQSIEVELKPGATIRGRMVDDEGKPIEGARIIPLIDTPPAEWGAFNPHWPGFVYLHGLEAETGADGTFTLEGMPEGVKCDILARERSAVRRRELSPDESKNVITLAGEGAFRGRVVNFLGAPVRNFRIKLGPPKERKPGDASGLHSIGYSSPGVTFTRDDGVFTLSDLTAGDVLGVSVVSESFGAGEVDRVVVDSLNHLKPADALTITLDPPHVLLVRAVDENAKPIDGARVTVIGNEPSPRIRWEAIAASGEETVTAATDGEGWAKFTTLSVGKGTVVVRARGFARTRLQWIDGRPDLLAILEPASEISGTVTVAAGNPIGEIRGSLSWGGGETMDVPVDPRTGHFTADALPSGQFQFAIFPKAGGARLFLDTIELKPGEALIKDLTITPPAPANPRD